MAATLVCTIGSQTTSSSGCYKIVLSSSQISRPDFVQINFSSQKGSWFSLKLNPAWGFTFTKFPIHFYTTLERNCKAKQSSVNILYMLCEALSDQTFCTHITASTGLLPVNIKVPQLLQFLNVPSICTAPHYIHFHKRSGTRILCRPSSSTAWLSFQITSKPCSCEVLRYGEPNVNNAFPHKSFYSFSQRSFVRMTVFALTHLASRLCILQILGAFRW